MSTNTTFLRIAADQWVPWCRVHEEAGGGISISGPMGNLLQVLAQQMNFQYELVLPPDRVWGSEFPNGTWSGMIGMLNRQEVDLAMGPFTVTRKRESVSDMSMPVAYANKALLMVRPSVQSDVAGFLKTFSPEVWLLILVSMLAISSTMTCLEWAESSIFHSGTKNIPSKAFIWMVKTLAQETADWLPKKDGGRLVATTWLLASLVFMSSYSGILTAMLTVPLVAIPIDSLQDLVAQSDIPWKLEGGSSMFLYFQDASDELRQRVFQGRSGTFKDCWADRHAIADGEFVAICDEITMKKAMSWDFSTTGQCHLYISQQTIYSSTVAVAFQTNSTYLSTANQIILALKGSGILDKWVNDQITNTSLCLRPPSADRSGSIAAIDLAAFGGPLLVLVGGLSLAFLAFLCEVVLGRGRTEGRAENGGSPSSLPPVLLPSSLREVVG